MEGKLKELGMENTIINKLILQKLQTNYKLVKIKDSYKVSIYTDFNKYVIKIYKELHKREDCKREVIILNQLQNQTINVPRVYDYVEYNNYSVIITQYINGKVMTGFLDDEKSGLMF